MRLVATYNIGNLPYADVTVPYMRRYAEKIDADFVEHTAFPGRGPFGSAATWFSLRAIKAFAVQDVYDQLLLVDTDVLILPGCRDLFAAAGDRIGVVQDMGIPMITECYRRWCREFFGESPTEGKYFNAGLIVVPRAAALRLLSHMNGPYPDGPLKDQHYLNLKVPKREPLSWLPPELNWLPIRDTPDRVETALEMEVVHFVGGTKRWIPEVIRRLEERAEEAGS